MSHWTKVTAWARRATLATAVVVAAASLSLAPGDPTSGASTLRVGATSPFCRVLITQSPQPPTGSNVSAYHVFAKQYLAYYEKLDAKAPSASVKVLLNQIVAILKTESATSNAKRLAALVNADQIKWASDWTAFARSIVACGDQVVNLL